jgi:homoserine kinase
MAEGLDEIVVEAPATVSNIACGFDILGYAVRQPAERLRIQKKDEAGIRIASIKGAELSFDPIHNISGVAASALLRHLGIEKQTGLEFHIEKLIAPGSGLGSSAAAAVAAVVGVNAILGEPLRRYELIEFALEGEKLASGNVHADNVAPCLFGGFRLVRSYQPLDVVEIQYPRTLHTTIIYPQIEVKTTEARSILPEKISLKDAITQWGNVGGLIAGLQNQNFPLISRSLVDVVAEPHRARLIPLYTEVKRLAEKYEALGCNISGSGPAIFILNEDMSKSNMIIEEAEKIYQKAGIDLIAFHSGVSESGAEVIS